MSDPTEPVNGPDSSTTITIRKWIADEISAIHSLLTYPNRGADRLPPELRDMAERMMAKGSAWPKWLIVGIGMRWMRSMLNEAPPPPPPPVTEDKPKRGAR